MNRNIKFISLMVISMVIWGGSWVCAKLISHNLHFQQLVFIRFVLTFLFLIPPVIILKEPLKIDITTAIKIVIGSLFYTLYSQVFFLGISLGMAGLGGVLVTTLVPIITYAFMSLSSRKGLKFRDTLGLVIGFGGSLFILKIWAINIEGLLSSGNIFFVLGAFLWSGVTINSHKTQSKVSIWIYSFYLNGFAVILQAFFVIPYGFQNLFASELFFWAFMTYLSLISTVFATSVYFYAAKNLGPHKASAFTFLVPLSAVVSSWIFLHEAPELTTLLGGFFSVCAVYLIHFGPLPDDIPGAPV